MKHFEEPTKPKKDPHAEAKRGWDFTGPDYDKRSSCFLNAGTDYGVGYAQPVGNKKNNPKSNIPVGAKRIDVNEKYEK